jgi:hypothetical protein
MILSAAFAPRARRTTLLMLGVAALGFLLLARGAGETAIPATNAAVGAETTLPIISDEHCLLYGAILLGLMEDEYYRQLCALSDFLGAETRFARQNVACCA